MILVGDCRETLRTLPDANVHMCVTSPPYWAQRAYWINGADGCRHEPSKEPQPPGIMETCVKCGGYRLDAELGSEPTPQAYVATMVEVFREVRRIMRDDATLWLNVGDAYCSGTIVGRQPTTIAGSKVPTGWTTRSQPPRTAAVGGLKPKDLCGIPWRLAFALQDDGWYLRQDIIWAKPAPMPESVRDRCTKAHEYLFLLTKRPRYYFDNVSIAEEAAYADSGIQSVERGGFNHKGEYPEGREPFKAITGKRNRRSVWTIASEPFAEAHFATYPPALVEPCILAGTSAKGVCPACLAPWRRITQRQTMKIDRSDRTHELGRTRTSGNMVEPQSVVTLGWAPTCKCEREDVIPATVLDPFLGAGTTGLVAQRLGRNWIGCELSESYADMARRRIHDDNPLFSTLAARA